MSLTPDLPKLPSLLDKPEPTYEERLEAYLVALRKLIPIRQGEVELEIRDILEFDTAVRLEVFLAEKLRDWHVERQLHVAVEQTYGEGKEAEDDVADSP